jgi:hypothetical protein
MTDSGKCYQPPLRSKLRGIDPKEIKQEVIRKARLETKERQRAILPRIAQPWRSKPDLAGNFS